MCFFSWGLDMKHYNRSLKKTDKLIEQGHLLKKQPEMLNRVFDRSKIPLGIRLTESDSFSTLNDTTAA